MTNRKQGKTPTRLSNRQNMRQRPPTQNGSSAHVHTLDCDSMIPFKCGLQTVLLWQLYMFVCSMHNSEETCKTMSLHVRILNASFMDGKRRRQDYGCTCMCGDSRGCPSCSGDKQAIRVTHRVLAELWTCGPQLVTGTIPPAANKTTGLWSWNGNGPVIGWPLCTNLNHTIYIYTCT